MSKHNQMIILGLVIPLLQAVATGILVGLVAITVLWAIGPDHTQLLGWILAAACGALTLISWLYSTAAAVALWGSVALISAGLAGGLYLAGPAAGPRICLAITAAVIMAGWFKYRDHAVWLLEMALGIDLDKDMIIGMPEDPGPRSDPVRVEITQGNSTQISRLPDGISHELVGQAAADIVRQQHTGFTLATFRAAGINRQQYELIRAKWLQDGLVVWRDPDNPNRGLDLTPRGRAVVDELAKLGSPTPR